MKHWQETSRVLRMIAGLAEGKRNGALATVIRISGSAYRRPGAKMLITDDGAMAGSVSGGCLEADVREVALSVMTNRTPRVLHYDTGGDDRAPFGLGLGCNGAVDIFIQPATGAQALEITRRILRELEGDRPFALSTVIEPAVRATTMLVSADGELVGSTGDARLDNAIVAHARPLLAGGTSELHTIASVQLFTEVLVPPPALVIIGAGEDSRPLAAFATEAGFRVTVVDHRAAYLDSAHYPPGTRLIEARAESSGVDLPLGPRAFAVVKTHSLAHDRDWVRRLLATEVPYIGVLGPRSRIDDILEQIGAQGNERVFGPVGLDLGGDGPEQVALSITAELLAVLSGREPGHLRMKDGVIHAG